MYDLPGYVWTLALVGAVGIPAATAAVLYAGGAAAGLGRRRAAAVSIAAAFLLGGWLVVSSFLAYGGVYRGQPHDIRPWAGVAAVGTLVALLLGARIPTISRALSAPGAAARLALPQTLRVVGVVFLIVMALGHLPALFALPAGLGDVAIGVSAPFVARGLVHRAGWSRAVWFNALGILDLVVAVSLGFLGGVTSLMSPSTQALTLLPLALIPTVAVPLAVALHIVSLRRLLGADVSSSTGAERSLLSPMAQ